jgi:hypothetical protein
MSLEVLAGDAVVVPLAAVPVMVSVIASPALIHMMVEPWGAVVMGPAPIVIMGAIPAAFIWTPPPAVPEEQFDVDIRGYVNFVCIRYFHQNRRSFDYYRRKTDVYMYTCPCLCRDRGDNYQCQKY